MLTALLDLVLPSSCAACGCPGPSLCAPCTGELTATPVSRHLPGLVVAAAGPYAGAGRACVLAHKERGRLALARPLGGALAAAVTALDLPGPLLLVPVPSARAAVRARGHDHARRTAAAAARSLTACGLPARVVALLAPVRAVQDQAGLDAAARAANLRGALACRGRPRGTVVVVDDVVTTGASLLEAARALRAAGADVAGAATVTATAGRSGLHDRSVPPRPPRATTALSRRADAD